jgi:hypothetical protein
MRFGDRSIWVAVEACAVTATDQPWRPSWWTFPQKRRAFPHPARPLPDARMR